MDGHIANLTANGYFHPCLYEMYIHTLGVKKVRGQSEVVLQIGQYVRPKTLISVEAKKLLIKILFNYLNDIQ